MPAFYVQIWWSFLGVYWSLNDRNISFGADSDFSFASNPLLLLLMLRSGGLFDRLMLFDFDN